jgi:hypothetical protein
MTAHHAISQDFNINYAENWGFLAIYLREMQECLRILTHAIDADNTAAARAELHQMFGATSIINYIGLEEKLVLLQSIIKSDQPSSEGAYLLSEIQALLDELFEYLMETRPDYDVHVLTSADDIVSTLIGLPQDDVRMTCTHSGNMEECISWLSSNDTDLIILDDQDPVMPEQLSSELESLCIEIPILVVMDQHVSKLLERFNDIVNINGAVIKSTPISQLLEVIKTIVNGRNFFQQKGKKQSE